MHGIENFGSGSGAVQVGGDGLKQFYVEIVVFVATCRDFDEGRLTALICPTVRFYKGLFGSRMRVIHSEHPCRAFKGEIMGCSEIAFKDIGELGDG